MNSSNIRLWQKVHYIINGQSLIILYVQCNKLAMVVLPIQVNTIYPGGDLMHECIIGTLELSNIF